MFEWDASAGEPAMDAAVWSKAFIDATAIKSQPQLKACLIDKLTERNERPLKI